MVVFAVFLMKRHAFGNAVMEGGSMNASKFPYIGRATVVCSPLGYCNSIPHLCKSCAAIGLFQT